MSSPAPAVELDRISKRYWIGERPERYDTLRDAIVRRFRRGGGSDDSETAAVWALREVSLQVRSGQVVGIVGRNGAGKSTLLKLVARITRPTEGRGRVRGRVGSLLDVGTGFHYELTGRENIYLGGSVLGLSRAEIRARFDEIVEFADIGPFLDTPLKRYSSGMHLRLAFSVAAHLPSEVLVVDEVLAVGDAGFQRKCLGAMSDVGRQGRTVLFVSHDLGAIQRLCDHALWLDAGTIRVQGSPRDVLDAYARSFGGDAYEATFPASGAPVSLVRAAVTDDRGRPVDAAHRDRPLRLRLQLRASRSVSDLDVGIVLERGGLRLLDEYLSDVVDGGVDVVGGREYEFSIALPPVLPAGDYELSAWAASRFETYWEREILAFRIRPRADDREDAIARTRLVQPDVRWEVQPLDEPHAP